MMTKGIHWGRIILAAFFTELAIFAVFLPVVLKYGNNPVATRFLRLRLL